MIDISIKIRTWYRESTKEWIAESEIDIAEYVNATVRSTGKSEIKATDRHFKNIGKFLKEYAIFTD